MPGSRATSRKSLILSTAGLVALVCFALIALDTARTVQAYRAQIAETSVETDNLARSLAQHVNDSIQTVDISLAGLKQRIEASPMTLARAAKLRDTMLAQRNTSPTIFALAFFDAEGTLLADTSAGPRPSRRNTDRDYFTYWRSHQDQAAFIGGPYRGRADATWIITVSRRIDNPDGSFGGVIVGAIALDLFKSFYASFNVGTSGILLLTRRDGEMVVRWPFDDSFVGRRPLDNQLYQKLVPSAPSGHFDNVSQIDGVTRLGSFRNVENYPLVVLAAFDRSYALADWRSEALAHAAGVLLVVLMIALLGFRLTQKISSDGRHTDERLRRSEKMEVIGRLAAGVAHDFNNILQVIMGGMEILRDEPSLSAQSYAFINEVESAANRGSSLTHHLLSYSRKQVLTPQLLDAGKTLDALRVVLSHTLRSNVSVSTNVAPGTALIEADPNQLQTALINLAINAEHAMPDGGTLRCEARMADADSGGELKPGPYVVIAVTDNGPGMTPEVLSQAFDPFFTTKGLDGSGLGLPMVQGFSRQSGGDVRVLSAPGQGTSVEIWLPAVPVPALKPVTIEGAAARSGRILLVDDSPDVLVMVDASLRKGGFSVRQAGNGHEALAALATGEQFDVLVTDYMMPGLNGLALIKEARLFQPTLPALIISGFADAAGFTIDLENVAFLRKPFHRDQLLARVSALACKADRLIVAPTA